MEYELLIRLGPFFGLFVLFALAEAKAPRRRRTRDPAGRRTRWEWPGHARTIHTVTREYRRPPDILAHGVRPHDHADRSFRARTRRTRACNRCARRARPDRQGTQSQGVSWRDAQIRLLRREPGGRQQIIENRACRFSVRPLIDGRFSQTDPPVTAAISRAARQTPTSEPRHCAQWTQWKNNRARAPRGGVRAHDGYGFAGA